MFNYFVFRTIPTIFNVVEGVKVKGKGEMTTYFLIDRKNQRGRNNYELIGSANNGSNRTNAITGGVPTPFSLINNKNNSQNNSNKISKKNTSNNDINSNTNVSNSPLLQPINRYPVKASDLAKRVDSIPSYNPPKPIITDSERPKMSKSPLNIQTIAEEPSIPEPVIAGKGDAWETLKELSSSVPPPPPESDHLVGSNATQRPLTIVSPTGVQETNLDDITPPLPPRDHSNNRPSHNSSLTNKSNPQKGNLKPIAQHFSSPITSRRTTSLTETNEVSAQSRDSLDDIDTTQATSVRGTGRPSSVDDSSMYHSSSSSSGCAPITDAETTYGGLTRTDLDTPSPAFNRNSGGSASLQWVYPNPENTTEREHSLFRTPNRDDYCLLNRRPNNDSFGSKGKTNSSAQTDNSQTRSKKAYNHINPQNSHSNANSQNSKQSYTGSYKSDGSSGTNSARRRHRNVRRDRSKDDDDINVPLLKKSSISGRTATSDTEEEFDLNQMGAASAPHKNRIDFVTRSPSFDSNSSRSQRKGSLPDYYKLNSNSNSKYGKIMPKKLPSMESVSKAVIIDSNEYSPKLRSKGSLPMIPLQELRNVSEVLADFGYKKERHKRNNDFSISFEEEEEKNESNADQLIASNKDNQSEHEIIKNRALNSKADTLLDMTADLVDLEDQFLNNPRPTPFRFPLGDIDFSNNKRKDCNKSENNSNANHFSQRKHTKESEYENLDSDDFPFYEGDNEDDDNQLTDDRLATDDSDEVRSDDQSMDESNRLFEDSAAAMDGMSVMNDAGLTDAEGALSDVNSLLNDGGNDADMDDTSMSSRSGASSRMLDNMDSINLMYDSEFEYPAPNRHMRPDILSDDECFNIGPSSDINIDYMSGQHSTNNMVAPNTLAERLENIRVITSNITRNFGQTKTDAFRSRAHETDDSEA